jgi:hypothetical protein
VVVGNAISRGNPELEEVLDRKIRYCSLPEAIREHFLWGARSVVVAGTHGKTTTTSLAGWLLTSGGADPSLLVGGIARNFGEHGSSYRLGHGREFVIEGDEYDSAFFDKTAKFLKTLPDCRHHHVESDHADITGPRLSLAFDGWSGWSRRRGPLLGADSARGLEGATSRASKRLVLATTSTGRPMIWNREARRRAFVSDAAGRRSAYSMCRSSARTTCGTRWPP